MCADINKTTNNEEVLDHIKFLTERYFALRKTHKINEAAKIAKQIELAKEVKETEKKPLELTPYGKK